MIRKRSGGNMWEITLNVVCVAWRFCRAGARAVASPQTSFGVRLWRIHECGTNEPQRTSAGRLHERRGREIREKNKIFQVAPAPISSWFLCPRPPLLLNAPNQNRHATQATLNVERLQYCCRRLQSLKTKLTRLWLDMNKISKSVI